MRYLALASDYDGTLAHDGVVDQPTRDALARFRQSGRKIILVTGRELADLEQAFPCLDLLDFIVAENGAVLFNPLTREKQCLAERPPDRFLDDLKRRGVPNLATGDVIVATWHPHETAVLAAIRELGLDLQVIFNKEAVMVLPTGMNKMTGLHQALAGLHLSAHNVVAIGDAENDLPFVRQCECAVAVENAIPALKEQADWVTPHPRGQGVIDLIERILDDDLASLEFTQPRHSILLGNLDQQQVCLPASGKNLLLCGQSGGGKSTFVAGFVERLVEQGYQICLIDPEGDYEALNDFFTVGNENQAPSFDQIFQLLSSPSSNLVINLVGVKMQDRPGLFSTLLARLQEKTLQEGRPHWLIIDEAHHLLPAEWAPDSAELAGKTASLMLVTVHPAHVSKHALRLVDVAVVVGKDPRAILGEFAAAISNHPPAMPDADLAPGQASAWFLDSNRFVHALQTIPGQVERKRHRRKYAEGELEEERVFWFCGPENQLHLRVNNLNTFLLIAAGIDDRTWLYHLHRHDFSHWIGQAIKDLDLAAEIEHIESDPALAAADTRQRITQAIETRYTAPA